MGAAEPIRVTDIRVRPDRLVIIAACADGVRRTTPALANALTAAIPTLPAHACVNDRGPTFGAVLADTSVPHVLEHLVIDAQARASADGATFVGTTVWTDETAGTARIEVSYADDLVALGAVKQALATLNAALSWIAPA